MSQRTTPRRIKQLPPKPLPAPRILYCQNPSCGKQISQEKIVRQGKRTPLYCGRTCLTEHYKALGIYKAKSKAGNAAQARIKAETGKVPGPPRGGARPGSGKRKRVIQ